MKLIIHLHFVSRLRICGALFPLLLCCVVFLVYVMACFPLLPLPSLWLVQVIACVTEFALILTLLEPTGVFLFKLRACHHVKICMLWVKG
jgi:hypothetical protein